MPAASLPTPCLQTFEDIAAQVLRLESAALGRLSDTLPADFSKVVTFLSTLCGKVICSGVGKSGHIAQKIASTLCSTGTPAYFLHPTEAGHGDLGGLGQGDVLLLLSNSGCTPELVPLITFAAESGLPLIAMTAKGKSPLTKAAQFVLKIQEEPEACKLGLAPTTSAILMLGLGDSLAVCLSHVRNLQASEYKRNHPSGSLGRKLLTVAEVMRGQERLPLVSLQTPMAEALLVMTEKSCGCVGVMNPVEKNLVGIITDGDLRRHMTPDLLTQPVEAIMTPHPLTVSPEIFVEQALSLMQDHKITVLFVQDAHAHIVGLLHVHDCLGMGDLT